MTITIRTGCTSRRRRERRPSRHSSRTGSRRISGLFLQGRDLFQEDLLEESVTVHDDALGVLAEMHALPVQDAAERARIYRERLLGSPAWRSLKRAMDLWCACWFWPADESRTRPVAPHLRRTARRNPGRCRSNRGRDALLPLGDRVPGRIPRSGLRLRRDPREPAVGTSRSPSPRSSSRTLTRSTAPTASRRRLGMQRQYFGTAAPIERDWLDYRRPFPRPSRTS